MHVGVDLDEVLSESFRFILSRLETKLSIFWEYDAITHHDFDEMAGFPLGKEAAISFFRKELLDPSHLNEVFPVAGSLENLAILARSHRLTCITARNPLLRDTTLEWLGKHFPGVFTHVELLGTHSTGITKGQACEALKVDIMIDDNMDYAVNVLTKNIPCVLLEKPWNRDRKESHPLLYRASDWNEIPHILDRTFS